MGVAQRFVGRKGKIERQVGTTTVNMKALTKEADNQTFASGNPYWLREPVFLSVIPDGLISGGSINPNATNSEVQTEAGSAYFAGVQVDFSADASVAVSRPTSGGNVRINAIVVDSSGAVTAIAGTEGTAGGARGAAGGPPFITVGSVLLGYWTGTSTSAALALASEIDCLSAERWNSPSFKINFITGKVIFDRALDLIHTASVPKKVYAQYKFAVMGEIGDCTDFAFATTTALVDGSAFDDDWMEEQENQRSASGSFNGFYVNGEMFDLASTVDGGITILRLYPTRLRGGYFVFQASVNWGITVAKDQMVTQAMPFKVIGAPVRIAA